MDNAIHIAVIIVNYNASKFLTKALNALSKQTYRPEEVILYDNASTEPISEAILDHHLPIKILRSKKNLGFAAGNNEAIQSLKPSINWIALLNPDAYPEENWLEEMVKAIHAHPDYAFFASKLICEKEPKLLDGTGDVYHLSGKAWRMNFRKPLDDAPLGFQEVFSPCAAAALYKRDAFQAAEGFDERFFCYYEDIDLAFRLRLLGYKAGYVPNAIAHHTGSATTKRHSDFYTYYGHRNLVWTYFKNMPSSLLILSLPLHLLLNLVTVLIFTARGQAKVILKSKFDALKGFKEIYQLRKKWQKKRVISQRDIFKQMNRGLPW